MPFGDTIDIELGQWCIDQHIAYESNTLQQDHIVALSNIEPYWTWDATESQKQTLWFREYTNLAAYVTEHNALPKTQWCAELVADYV